MGHPAVRETIESLIIALVLAFLFRAFEAEAFVIPTGSMAPTLMGQHKDIFCPNCGCQYQVSASATDKEHNPMEAPVGGAICPMCRMTADLTGRHEPAYPGDRILVGKFCYQFAEPKRWDVFVFHYPCEASTNYIKRLVGLPGETLRITHGALWTRPNDEPNAVPQIARKPPEKLLAMLQPVFDNDYMAAIRKKDPWPARWSGAGWTLPQKAAASPDEAGAVDEASFETDGKSPGEIWLRYRHLVPSFDQWEQMTRTGGLQTPLLPSLISDFVAYDTGQSSYRDPRPESLGLDWVGDLALQYTLESQSAAGQTTVELVKGGRRFRCRINLADGQAALSISGLDREQFHPKAATPLGGQGSHRLMFANADDQLLLWVDDKLVAFDAPTTYDSRVLQNHLPTPADLSPVGIAAEGAALRVSHLKILRNVYYIAIDVATQRERERERDREGGVYRERDSGICEYIGEIPDLSNPSTWHRFQNVQAVEFRLERFPSTSERDQFFAMGDNSAMSSDSRLWPCQNYVDRKLLIGKALFIYWPHSWNKVTIAGHDIPFPFFPNFQKMGLVR